MLKRNPDLFRLILKEGKDISPCIICYSMEKRAHNFIRDPISLIEWKESSRPFHFEVPDSFKIGDFIEVGFTVRNYLRTSILEFIEENRKGLVFELQEKRSYEIEPIEFLEPHWLRS